MNSLDTKLRPTPDKRMASFLGFANMASTQVFAIMPPIAGREWIKQEKRLSPCTFRQVGWRYRPNKITCQQNRPSSALAFLQHAEILFSSGLRPCDVSYSGCLPIWCFKIPWLYHVFPDLFSKNPWPTHDYIQQHRMCLKLSYCAPTRICPAPGGVVAQCCTTLLYRRNKYTLDENICSLCADTHLFTFFYRQPHDQCKPHIVILSKLRIKFLPFKRCK